ncbi:type III polyketide synthase [Dendrosporobacter sp. 1207_IL3150]|uniref:type III polyketide synthase n=1 Tax=Dendrosporobacter sp. 1207_IL3150 TaxID=3084054 RepID=UPI002FD8903B
MTYAKLLSVGLAVPENRLEQTQIKEYISALFCDEVKNLDRLMPIFDNSAIKTRNLVKPLEWYSEAHSFAETSSLYESAALKLAEEAARQALDRANVMPSEVGAIIFVSSTGISTPTIDAKLISSLKLSSHTVRIPIWGLGCAGGAAGLARAAELAKTYSGKAVLLVTVELCSLTFQRSDLSKSNLVGTGLFADGAAAAILSTEGEGPAILGSLSTLISNSEDVMGWDIVDTGLKVRFSRDIPAIVRQYLPELMEYAKLEWGIELNDVEHYIVHPGGPKVIEAYIESLKIDKKQVAEAYSVLSQYGNMSSSSVLFVLEQYLRSRTPVNKYGVMLALGPGFSAEQVLFRW